MFVWLLCFHIWVKQDKIMFIKKCLNTPTHHHPKTPPKKQTTKQNNNTTTTPLPAFLNINYGKNIWLFKLTLYICSSNLGGDIMNSSYCEAMKYKHYTCLKGPSKRSCLGVLYDSLPPGRIKHISWASVTRLNKPQLLSKINQTVASSSTLKTMTWPLV